jgi:hypothetical protein
MCIMVKAYIYIHIYIFLRSPEAAVKVIKTDRLMTIVTERLMESLVVMSHYMGWSLADVVVTGIFIS